MDVNENRSDTVAYDPQAETYLVSSEKTGDSPGITLVEAVAEIEGRDPTALEPLGNTLDIEALDRILQSPTSDCDLEVSLRYQGYQVTIHSEGHIELQQIPPT